MVNYTLDNQTKITDIFPSLIYQTVLDLDLSKMLKTVEELVNQIHPPGSEWDTWFGHYTMPSLELVDTIFKDLKEQKEYHANKFYKTVHDTTENIELKRMWGIVFNQGGSMRPHTHHECLYSSCFYLKNNLNGKIVFTHPSQLRFNAVVDFAPLPGELIIWPGWLLHEVPAIKDNTQRVSIAGKLDYTSPKTSLENRQLDSEYQV